jgi:hypothetical protein
MSATWIIGLVAYAVCMGIVGGIVIAGYEAIDDPPVGCAHAVVSAVAVLLWPFTLVLCVGYAIGKAGEK